MIVARLLVLGAVMVALRQLAAGPPATPERPPAAGASALPGAAPRPPELRARLAAALAERGSADRPRTRHLTADGTPKYTNRLLLEDSPYLQQHAHNPVDWYPWGEEAFARARREGKPILLSVGYSTCHWCHVMEEESFEDEEIAALLNRHYVAIKVDRERRPDIDATYMTAVQAMGSAGGWPMTVWLTSDGKPFHGGTYFPPRDGDRGVRIGFLTLLDRLHTIYREQPERVAAAAAEVTAHLAAHAMSPAGTALPSAAVLDAAFAALRDAYDPVDGGFGRAPKFPRSVQLELLLRHHRRSGDPAARAMVERTLSAMASGGIYDHVGGGFHRYATDAGWRVPHFEKMLYDNALLVVAYLEAYQVTGNPDFARVARETLAYVTRDMTAPDGAFYSATDADSEGVEGKYFVWTAPEIAAALDPEAARLAIAYYGVEDPGPFDGANILHTPRPLALVAADLGLDPTTAPALLDTVRRGLDAARRRRVPPLTDEKILTAWNGLMISALARAAQVLNEPAYADAAARAARFILYRMRRGPHLQRSYFNGRASGDGYLDDYGFFIAGLLDLYEATFDPLWLARARSWQENLDRYFWDEAAGGYFLTADHHETLLVRDKPSYDGAEPSGNSVAALNLLRFYELTGEERFRERADRLLAALAPVARADPAGAARLLGALDFRLDRVKEIVVVTPGGIEGAAPFLRALAARFVPNKIVVVGAEGPGAALLAASVPLVRDKIAQNGRPTAYVCENRVCKLPTTDPAVFAKQLSN